ncbi:MAG TPA: hypothetical protein VGW40_12090 [Allosphingosinicella sp.]|nr:hypothetical protein [Allosphingosinicella sp.]
MRLVLAVLLAALTAAPLAAQKPGAELDPEREQYRTAGISLCVAELNAVEGVTPDESEAICGCALDRFLASRPAGALRPLGGGRFRSEVGGRVLACTFSEARSRTGAVSRWMAGAAAPAVAPPPVAEAPPVADEGGKPTETTEAPEPDGPGLRERLGGLSLPRWLTSSDLPLWVWIPLVVFVFLFLRGLFRRSEGRDLDGPPPSMRHRP